jgi:GNAT superfamily N-acetyltransferase
MSDLRLRETTDADLPTLVALIHAAFEEYRGRLDPPSGAHRETLESVRDKLRTGRALLALVDGEPAGGVFYHRENDHVYLGRLAVLPQHRRRGVGRALVMYVEAWARSLDVPRTRLGVRVQLPANRAYFERLGYRVFRHEAHEGYSEPTYLLLEKDLSVP